jgi:hypothetical protein
VTAGAIMRENGFAGKRNLGCAEGGAVKKERREESGPDEAGRAGEEVKSDRSDRSDRSDGSDGSDESDRSDGLDRGEGEGAGGKEKK